MKKRIDFLFAVAVGIYFAFATIPLVWFLIGVMACALMFFINKEKVDYNQKRFLIEFSIICICGGPISLLFIIFGAEIFIYKFTKKQKVAEETHSSKIIDYLLAQDNVTKIEFLKVEDEKYEVTVDGKYAGRHSHSKDKQPDLVKTYIKNGEEVRAIQFSDFNKDKVFTWTSTVQQNIYPAWDKNNTPILKIPTSSNELVCALDDYLVLIEDSTDWQKFNVCQKEKFESTHTLKL